MLTRIFAFICLSLLFLSVCADQDFTALNLQQAQNHDLSSQLQYLEDPNHDLDVRSVLAQEGWQKQAKATPNFGFSTSAYWLRTTLNNSSATTWSLWVHYALLDSMQLWLCPLPLNDLSQCQHQEGGDTQPFSARALPHPSLIFSLPMDNQASYLLLIRVQSNSILQLPLSLIDNNTLENELLTNNIWRGIYYATLLVLALYNLFIFLALRKRSYWHFSLFSLSFLLLHMAYEGSAFQLFWPSVPSFNRYALPVFFALNLLTITFFVPQFLRLSSLYSGLFRLFRVFSAIILVSLLLLPLLPYDFIIRFYSGLNLIVMGTACWIGWLFWFRHEHATRFFTLGFTSLILGLGFAILNFLSWLPPNALTQHAYQFGSFFGIIFLSLSLGERTVFRQKEELKEKSLQLERQEEKIQALYAYDFTRSNTAWRAILGYSDEGYFLADNPKFNSLFSESKQRKKFWREIKDQGKLRARVLYFTQPVSGERIVVSISLRKGNTNKAAWFGAGQDVTDNYLKQQALLQIQQEKTQSLRQLVVGISQEMNTPLSNIRLARDFLEADHPDWSEAHYHAQLKENLNVMHQGTDRLHELNALMKNAVIQANQYAQEDIHLRQWLELWQEEQHKADTQIKIRLAVHSYLIDWPTYPEALKIVLTQLLQYCKTRNPDLLSKGALKISVDLRERSEFLELHFQDNGKALDKTQRENLFMPFISSGVQSRGLGLYQSYNLITELLQGFIEWPEESEGFYLVVRFTLPVFVDKNVEKADQQE
jgi:signal transduction histidine kinase